MKWTKLGYCHHHLVGHFFTFMVSVYCESLAISWRVLFYTFRSWYRMNLAITLRVIFRPPVGSVIVWTSPMLGGFYFIPFGPGIVSTSPSLGGSSLDLLISSLCKPHHKLEGQLWTLLNSVFCEPHHLLDGPFDTNISVCVNFAMTWMVIFVPFWS